MVLFFVKRLGRCVHQLGPIPGMPSTTPDPEIPITAENHRSDQKAGKRLTQLVKERYPGHKLEIVVTYRFPDHMLFIVYTPEEYKDRDEALGAYTEVMVDEVPKFFGDIAVAEEMLGTVTEDASNLKNHVCINGFPLGVKMPFDGSVGYFD